VEERTVTKREARQRLGARTRYAYLKLITDGILDPAIGTGHGYHTESQIRRAQERLRVRASGPVCATGAKTGKFRKLSARMTASIQRT
jgi:hypothetical protein